MSNNIKSMIKEILLELDGAQKTNILLGGKPFKLVLDVNKNPTKKGVKVQFVPLEIEADGDAGIKNSLSDTQQNDLQIKILDRLNKGLRPMGLEADIDPDVPYSNVIGYYIHLQYFDKLIRNALKNGAT